MTKKSTGFLIAALMVIAGLIAYFYSESNNTVPQATVSIEDTEPQKPVTQGSGTESNIEQAVETAVPSSEIVDVELTEEQPILGQFMRVREVKEKQDGSEYGSTRNLEFVFRPGILPRRLFESNDNVIVRYDQLYKNNVGAGAVTVLFYYEVVTADTNSDGVLSSLDGVDIAVSFPDGSEYTTLVSNVDKVFAYEQLAVENGLRLMLQLGDRLVKQTYSLDTKKLVSEEQIQYIE